MKKWLIALIPLAGAAVGALLTYLIEHNDFLHNMIIIGALVGALLTYLCVYVYISRSGRDQKQDRNVKQAPQDVRYSGFWATLTPLLNPVTLTSLIILLSIIFLIVTDIYGWDKGNILQHLAEARYARGLITYLFAVGTIGAVIVLMLAALTDEGQPGKFTRAKEVLSLLIGLFGSIIGFYFGSAVGEGPKFQQQTIQIVDPMVPRTIKAGDELVYITHVGGGEPPYNFAIRVGTNSNSKPLIERTTSGWIDELVPASLTLGTNTLTLRLDVSDSLGNQGFALTDTTIQ